VIAISLPHISFCSAYTRKNNIIELSVLDSSEPILQMYSENDSVKDFGRRVRNIVRVKIDLEIKKIDVVKDRVVV
jgi:hypothetical protein